MNLADEQELEHLLKQFTDNLEDINVNIDLASFYYNHAIYASAVTHYLNALTVTQDENLIYEIHLRLSLCFAKLGDRSHTELHHIYLAHSLDLKRSESYHTLALYYSYRKNWAEALTYARGGLRYATFNTKKILIDEYLDDKHTLMLIEAISLDSLGLNKEYKQKIYDLYIDPTINSATLCIVIDNMIKNGVIRTNYVDYRELAVTDGCNVYLQNIQNIKQNFSQVYQDLFVLHCLGGDSYKGTYLEIGSGHFFQGNNTFLLESLGWNGISVDVIEQFVKVFKQHRKNEIIQANGMYLDYITLMANYMKEGVIDYLQIDCDTPSDNLSILKKIPFDKCKFKIITFEHDHYRDCDRKTRQESRDFLISLGYQLAVPNVTIQEKFPFEDWYIHPDFIDFKSLDIYKYINDQENKVELIFKN